MRGRSEPAALPHHLVGSAQRPRPPCEVAALARSEPRQSASAGEPLPAAAEGSCARARRWSGRFWVADEVGLGTATRHNHSCVTCNDFSLCRAGARASIPPEADGLPRVARGGHGPGAAIEEGTRRYVDVVDKLQDVRDAQEREQVQAGVEQEYAGQRRHLEKLRARGHILLMRVKCHPEVRASLRLDARLGLVRCCLACALLVCGC